MTLTPYRTLVIPLQLALFTLFGCEEKVEVVARPAPKQEDLFGLKKDAGNEKAPEDLLEQYDRIKKGILESQSKRREKAEVTRKAEPASPDQPTTKPSDKSPER